MDDSNFRGKKFFLLISHLSSDDRQNFKLFLEAPSNKGTELHSRVFQSLEYLVFQYKGEELSPDKLWERLYPDGREFNANRYSRLLSEAKALLDEWLCEDELRRRADEQKLLTVQAYNRRGMDIEKLYADAQKEKQKSLFKNDDHFDFLQRLEWEYCRYLIRTKGRKSKGEPLFDQLLYLIDEVHYLRRMEITVAALNRHHTLGSSNEVGQVDQILRHIEQDIEACPPALQFFYHIYCLISPEVPKGPGTVLLHFNGADRILQSERGKCPPGEFAEYYGYLLNECFRQINEGNLEFQPEAWRIFRRYLDEVVEPYRLRLSSFYYKNYISLCARLGKFEEAWEFWATYGVRLVDDKDGIAQLYNEGVLLYYEDKFEQALSKFRQSYQLAEEIFYRLDTRVYLWRCEYELSLLFPEKYPPVDLDSHYDSFRRFVKQCRQISEIHRTNYVTFISYFRKFITKNKDRLKDKQKLQSLLKKLEKERNVANIQWLIQKIRDALGQGA